METTEPTNTPIDVTPPTSIEEELNQLEDDLLKELMARFPDEHLEKLCELHKKRRLIEHISEELPAGCAVFVVDNDKHITVISDMVRDTKEWGNLCYSLINFLGGQTLGTKMTPEELEKLLVLAEAQSTLIKAAVIIEQQEKPDESDLQGFLTKRHDNETTTPD